MAFNFDYSIKKAPRATSKDTEPLVTIYNNTGRKDIKYDGSYLFINKAAVKLLQTFGKVERVKVGIDTETQKIVVIPSNTEGRKMSIQQGGSAQVSISNLISENKIPTQTCSVRAYDTYAKGGILFDYVMTTK